MSKVLILSFALMFSIASLPLEAQSAPEGLSMGHLPGFDVAITMPLLPSLGGAAELQIRATPQWENVGAAVAHVTVARDGALLSERWIHLRSEGADAVASVTLRADAPGEQSVWVLVSGEDRDGNVPTGQRIGFLRVTSDGGSSFYVDSPPITDEPFPAVPAYDDPSPPFDPDSYVEPLVDLLSLPPLFNDDPTTGGALDETFRVTGCWNFRGPGDVGSFDQRWALVKVMDDDSSSGDDELWSGYTLDPTGCFTSGWIEADECCFQGRQDVYLLFVMLNGHVDVDRPTAAGTYEYSTGTPREVPSGAGTWDWGPWVTNSGHIGARQFQYANNAWAYGDLQAGRTIGWRPQLETPENCPDGSSVACYFYAIDTIYIPSSSDGTPDTTGHEYAHFVMDKFYGAFDGGASGGHSWCQDGLGTTLAWSEGFADFYGARTNYVLAGTPGADGNTNYKSNTIESGSCSGVIGEDNEANIARTLWDLADWQDDGESVDRTESDVLWIVDDCDDNSFWDYYNSGCSWASHSLPTGDPGGFLDAARLNNLGW